MVDKEMLSAISELLEEKLEKTFDEKLKPICNRLDNVNTDIGILKSRMGSLEADMKYVKEEQLEGNVIPQLDGLKAEMKIVRVDQLENDIIPRLNTIEAYYIDTSERYMKGTEQIGEMVMDISILQSTVKRHSKKLNKIQV